MGNDNYKQGSDFFMTFSGKKEKSILDFPTKNLQNTLITVSHLLQYQNNYIKSHNFHQNNLTLQQYQLLYIKIV